MYSCFVSSRITDPVDSIKLVLLQNSRTYDAPVNSHVIYTFQINSEMTKFNAIKMNYHKNVSVQENNEKLNTEKREYSI